MRKPNILEDQSTKELFHAILALRTEAETKRFFRDLLTEAEISEFANRWKAARMLYRKILYSEIERETGLSSTTVARVARWLRRGMDGYMLMIRRLGN